MTMTNGITYRESLDQRIYHAIVDGRPVPGPVEIEYRGNYGEAAYQLALIQARVDAGELTTKE
jgi:hypothetical protein